MLCYIYRVHNGFYVKSINSYLGRNVLTFSSSDVGAGIFSVDMEECAFFALAVMRSIGLGLALAAPSPTSSFSVFGELFASLDMTNRS